MGKDKLKFYLIERNDHIDWDEYDSCVVLAKTPEQAKEIAMERYGTDRFDGWGEWDVTITEIDTSESRVILGSFNAG